MARLFAALGVVAYALWGLLHLLAAANSFGQALAREPGLTQGRLLQGAFYVAFFVLVAVVVAATQSWRNTIFGYWCALIAVSAADIPFVLFIAVPGHMTGPEVLVGPALWLAGATFSTVAVITARTNAARSIA